MTEGTTGAHLLKSYITHTPWILRRIGKVISQPVQALIETSSIRCTAGLHKPLAVGHIREAELLRQLSDRKGVRKILLVGKHKDGGIVQLLLVRHLVQFCPCFRNTVAIIAINNVDQPLGVCEIMACSS